MKVGEREARMTGESSKCYGSVTRTLLIAGLVSAWVTALPAGAAPVIFDFETIPLIGNASNGLGATADSAAVQTYMTNALQAQGNPTASVAVTGALATRTYNGEGHVIGQTLGTSNGGVPHPGSTDTFIINNNFGLVPATGNFNGTRFDQFTLVFTNYLVSSISFDYEIFPNAACAAGSSCAISGNQSNFDWPDIGVLIGNDVNSLSVHWLRMAPVPGNPQTTDPQDLGTMTLAFPSPVSVIRFRDWPAEIGIDNLTVNRTPEPGSLPLLGLAALAGLLMARSRSGRSRARAARAA